MDSDKPTDPHVQMITQEDIMSYLVGAVQRIEAQLASEEAPPWAKKMLGEFSDRLKALEEDVAKIKTTCAARHGNGQLKLLL